MEQSCIEETVGKANLSFEAITSAKSPSKVISRNDIVYGHGTITGIVAVSTSRTGRVTLWQRAGEKVIVAKTQFLPWALVKASPFVKRLNGCKTSRLTGGLQFNHLVEITDHDSFESSAIAANNDLFRDKATSLRDVSSVHSLSKTEQFLVASGHTFFKGMVFSDLRRMSFNIETTDRDPMQGMVSMIGISMSNGYERSIHGMDEKSLLKEFNAVIKAQDPDIFEGYDTFEFDIPFLLARYKKNRIPATWGRDGAEPWSHHDSIKVGENSDRFVRYIVRGRQLIDILHAVRRYDAIKRVLPTFNLRDVARHFGFETDDVGIDKGQSINENANSRDLAALSAVADARRTRLISDLLTPVSFALGQMVPLQFEKICTSGPTALIELPMLRAYLRAKHSVPAPKPVEKFDGGYVELCQRGVFKNVIKLDVASMYPSIITNDKIGPHADPLGTFQVLAETWRKLRLEHKERGKSDPRSSAIEGALKILTNGMFGYLGYARGLFNNPGGAAQVTATGRLIAHGIKQSIIDLGGTPIEVDTDGIMCTFPIHNYRPDDFAAAVTSRLGRSGIVISSESQNPWTAAYVYKAKNYAYLDCENLKMVGSALKSRSMEPFLRRFLDRCMRTLLAGEDSIIRDIFMEVNTEIGQRMLTAEQVCMSETITQSLEAYKLNKNVRRPAIEVLITAGIGPVRSGFVSKFYKADGGYRHASQFQRDYDIDHYQAKLRKKAQVFEGAFSRADFASLIDLASPLECNAIASTSTIVPPIEVKPWINLAINIKRSKADPDQKVNRTTFSKLEDEENISAFRESHRNLDIYRSVFAYFSAERPSGATSKCLGPLPMLGDFWIELEGSRDDARIMDDAARGTVKVVSILERDLGIDQRHVRVYFNGGNSFYIRVPHAFFVIEPTLRLCDAYKFMAGHIRTLMPEDLKKRIDGTIYADTQLVRIPGSVYPGGGVMVEIPISIFGECAWRDRIGLIEPPHESELDPFFMSTTPDVVTEKSQGLFRKISAGTRFKVLRVGRKCQWEKSRIIRNHLANSAPRIAPCVTAMATAIAGNESLGFYGRCKLLYEATQAGVSEDEICQIFLTNGDPKRYGIMEPVPNPIPGSSGYEITRKYRASFISDCGCDKPDLGPFCDAQNCYRSSLRLNVTDQKFGDGDPSFEDFQANAREKLREFLHED